MSNKLFQSIVHQMHDAVGRTIGVIDETSVVIACSNLDQIGEVRENVTSDFFKPSSTFIINGYTYKAFDCKKRSEYAVFVKGEDESAQRYVSLLAISLGNIKKYYDAKYDKSNFIKNVILDNILPGDIYIKSRELHFEADVTRVCMLIRLTSRTELLTYELIQNMFPERNKDFVININEDNIVLVKEVSRDIKTKDLKQLAKSIVDTLLTEHYIHCLVGIGSIVSTIKDLAFSFKEAQVAIEVGKIFDSESSIISYDNLGIARLVYQLPTTLCEMYLKEVFKYENIDALDQETLFTIQRFFENNLNVSETSRKLFIHRNTLVYRLDRIKKVTGLDVREFDDAIVFKVAMMVKKYLVATAPKY
ncbi:MAG: helix-turn-helix domain-containing protein [Clostridia bacterium]|nr:helix-turn-helix domain-containing protein [Clostridia bacterium]